jgi:hypothetical protein
MLQTQGLKLRLQWVPAHQGVEVNEIAHKHARLATKKRYTLTIEEAPRRLKSTALRIGGEAVKVKGIAAFQNNTYKDCPKQTGQGSAIRSHGTPVQHNDTRGCKDSGTTTYESCRTEQLLAQEA